MPDTRPVDIAAALRGMQTRFTGNDYWIIGCAADALDEAEHLRGLLRLVPASMKRLDIRLRPPLTLDEEKKP